MSVKAAALLLILICYISVCLASGSSLIKLEGAVADITSYEDSLIIAFSNGTLIRLCKEALLWRVSTNDKGLPVLLQTSEPYGVLVFTNTGWIGLISPKGEILRWQMLPVGMDPISRGYYSLRYSNGTAVIFVGNRVYILKLPGLEIVASDSVANRYMKCSVSDNGEFVFLLGINTFCYSCIQADQRLIVVKQISLGNNIARYTQNYVRDAAVNWAGAKLLIANWSALLVCDLKADRFQILDSIPFLHQAKYWKSWGFSPKSRFFHYTYLNGSYLNLYVFDLELRVISSRQLDLEFQNAAFMSEVDDTGNVLILCRDPSSGNSHYILLDSALNVVISGSWPGQAKGIVLAEHAGVFSEKGALVLEHEAPVPTEKFLVHVKTVKKDYSPVPGVLICANNTCGFTSASGTILFNLPKGLVTLSASHKSFAPYSATVSINGNENITLKLQQIFILNISSRFDNGTVPKLCRIQVFEEDTSIWTSEVIGCSTQTKLPEGNYTILVASEGVSEKRFLGLFSDTSVELMLKGTFPLRIVIEDEDGKPCIATVTVSGENDGIATVNGSAIQIALPKGRYIVEATAPGYSGARSEILVPNSTEVKLVLTKVEKTSVWPPDPVYAVILVLVACLVVTQLLLIRNRRKLMRSSSRR